MVAMYTERVRIDIICHEAICPIKERSDCMLYHGIVKKTDIIVYVICGQHSLFHRWRTSPKTCQEVQIKSLESNLHRQEPQADRLVKGSEISHSNITTSSNFRVTQLTHPFLAGV